MIDQIKQAVHDASISKQKIAMFHFQVLKNAAELESLDPKSFCLEIGVPDTYKTEFTKMLGLARVMREQGVRLT